MAFVSTENQLIDFSVVKTTAILNISFCLLLFNIFKSLQLAFLMLWYIILSIKFHVYPNILWHYDLPNNWPYGIIVSSVKQSILNLSSFLENSFMIRQHLLNLYPEKLLNMRVSVCQRPVMIMLAVGWKVIISK